jgi:YYY domain-containing protein
MLDVITWWLVLEVVGVVAFPLAFVVFPRFPDRGYAFAKPIGLLGIGFVFWILGSAWVLTNNAGGIAWVVLMFGFASGYFAWRRKDDLRAFFVEKWKLIVFIEGLFLVAFLVGAYLRSFTPEISGTEKPMDFAFLNASTVSEHFAPNDPWLSGHTISYYYGGYFLVAMVGKLAHVSTSIGYNLGLAMIAALAVVGAFGLVYNLVFIHQHREGDRTRFFGPPLVFGIVAAVLLTVMGNLEGLLEFMAAHGMGGAGFWNWVNIKGLTSVGNSTTSWYPTANWWWWHGARVMSATSSETITEFPFFSFLLGDLHPHVMAIPFGLLGIAAAVRLLQEDHTLDLSFWSEHQLLLIAMAILVGGLSFLNTWDLPTFFFLLFLAALVRNYLNRKKWDGALIRQTLGFAIPLGVVSILAYVPYHKAFIPAFGFASQANGIAPVETNGTLPLHLLIMWGPFAVIVLPFVLARFVASLRKRRWYYDEWIASIPAVLVVGFWLLWVLARGHLSTAISDRGSAWLTALILMAVLTLFLATLRREIESFAQGDSSLPVVLTMIAASLAALLLLGAEFFYIKDVFADRMNTVFKFYYQAWILLAIAAGFALYYLIRPWLTGNRSFGARSVWAACAVVVLAAGLAYPLGATFARTEDFGLPRTLDGLAFVKGQDEYAAAQWLAENAKPTDVIAETVGDQQTGWEWGSTGDIASWTGLSTVLAWPGHEVQWRGGDELTAGRLEDVDALYQTTDPSQVQSIVAKYGIDYIVVGVNERQVYAAYSDGLAKFDSIYAVVFRSGDTVIYKVSE